MRMTRRSGKILYVKNDEPDNYIGPSFLQELKKKR